MDGEMESEVLNYTAEEAWNLARSLFKYKRVNLATNDEAIQQWKWKIDACETELQKTQQIE